MKIDKHLRKQGFDFYSERTKQEAPPKFGSTKKLVSVCVLNGSGWRGDTMNGEIQIRESALLNNADPEEFAWLLVTLIKNNREVRCSIMGLVLAYLYTFRQYQVTGKCIFPSVPLNLAT